MTSCLSSSAALMMSPVPTSRASTSYPTPRTQSTAHVLTALKSSSTKIFARNEISPEASLEAFQRPLGEHKHPYTFSAEEDRVEEKALSFLDRAGYLSQVAGSQSMLSQELLSQEEHHETQGLCSSQFSTASTGSPMSIARRYGILTQEMDDENSTVASSAKKNSLPHPFQTPPRKSITRTVITASRSNAEMKKSANAQATLEEEALHGTQPSLTLSQLEEEAGVPIEAPPMALQGAEMAGRPRRGSTSSLISLCNVAQKHIQDEQLKVNKGKKTNKRKYNRKLPTHSERPSSTDDCREGPSLKKPKTMESALGIKMDLVGEIESLGSAYKVNGDEAELDATAKRAAALAHRIIEGEDELAQRLLLSMALNRNSPRHPPSQWPEKGPVPEGFVWAHYPPLEALLKENMEEYYTLSMAKSQSSKQQVFNNTLVDLMRDKASQYEWIFPADRRALRDRIRCYFKTHLQNAKKRLRTLLRNPTKRANAKNLVKLMNIISDKSLAAKLTDDIPPSSEAQVEALGAPSDASSSNGDLAVWLGDGL